MGADIDATKLDLAREEAAQLDLSNVEFRTMDIRHQPEANEFDFVHARFLLTHLSDPIDDVEAFHHQLKPDDWCLLQDIDYRVSSSIQNAFHFVASTSSIVT